jgi:predicted SnoaL-like aldol condensation-catalyzing enzyme
METVKEMKQDEQNASEMKETTLSDASRSLLLRHLSSFQNNELEVLMSDYTRDSVLITEDKTYIGPEQIKSFFTSLIIHFPKDQSTFILNKMIVQDELVFIVWHANTPSLDVTFGTDTFIIKNGKILQQTFVGQLKFLN